MYIWNLLEEEIFKNVATFLVGIAGIILAYAQFKRSKQEVILKFFEQGDSKKQKDLRRDVHHMTKEQVEEYVERYKRGEQDVDIIFTEIISFYDTWGKLTLLKYLPIKAFEGMSGFILMRIYEKVEPYIIERRKKEYMEAPNISNCCYAYYFEELYKKIKNKTARQYKSGINL